MNPSEPSPPPPRRREPEPEPEPEPPPPPSGPSPLAFIPFDPIRILIALTRGWYWILLSGLLLAGPLGALAWARSRTSYTATVQLIRRELPNSFRVTEIGEAFKPRQLSVASVVSIMRSPSLLARVGAEARPRMNAPALLQQLTITPEKNTDLISVTLATDRGPTPTIDLLNRYAREVVDLTSSLQQQEAAELDRFLRDQIARTDSEFAAVGAELTAFSRETGFYNEEKEVEAYLRDLGNIESQVQANRVETETIQFRIGGIEKELARQSPSLLQLAAAKNELKSLLLRYTESNPIVQEQQFRIRSLEAEAQATTNAASDFQPGANTVANSLFVDLVTLRAQLEALLRQADPLGERKTNVQNRLTALPEKALRYARLRARQQSLESARSLLAGRQREAQLFAENSPGYYRLFAPATPDDITVSSRGRKVVMFALAGLVLGCGLGAGGLGIRESLDSRLVSPGDMRRALGAPTLAQLGNLSAMSREELVVWRFRTWSTLSSANGNAGNQSLTAGLTSGLPGEGRSTWLGLIEQAASERGLRTLTVSHQRPADPSVHTLELARALENPGEVTQRLEASGALRLALISGPDWVWTPERRAQWVEAITRWSSISRLAFLAELPPADRLETWLLAEALPQVFWVCRSGRTTQEDVGEAATTLQSGTAQLGGIFANEIPEVFFRWPDLGRFGLALALGAGLGLLTTVRTTAAEPSVPDGASTNNAFLSAMARGPHLAGWQERLTLGAGDQVNLAVYGHKEMTRTEVAIGPDGRLSYLQAQGIQAAGLTIDELRDTLSRELSAYYRNARVIVTPSSFRSKKYFLMGTVIDRGAFPLDRPMTIIEAIARARGIATGLLEQNTVEIADLPRAFLIRNQKRVPVDFVRLFRHGDLSQNIQIEPGDYIYFPSSVLNEVYVLGSVMSPGTVGVTDQSSLVGVLTIRGGFTLKAYRQKVLVVRGSLSQPETFVINVADVLRGTAPDFPLMPKDIVYVADRPWARAEDLLDMAITAFATTAVNVWAGQNIGPFITTPIIPSIK
ncbi:MAG: polysaccharide biosynthesis/export family protein [Verrucomicrobiales bacterium]|nr:polysaccharide biosynthesis/export family protein [Verrucomicrobiales bacterium]